jgi:UDP-N-acetyl-D-galactosamine dehydrogenase
VFDELSNGIDKTLEVDIDNLSKAKQLTFTSKIDNIKCANIYIITVPTPIDKDNNPDISLLLTASKMIGQLLNKGDIVIYESTVYPGCTEEECVPVLETSSNMEYNKDFYCGYSPERINPGDKEHTLTQIVKVTSGSNSKIAGRVDELYKNIITAGTHLVSSIKVAESAKIIENCQRDINIAFINELAIVFNLLDVDTEEVLDAANTKWNFINFRPGLVGGHCIVFDPYF